MAQRKSAAMKKAEELARMDHAFLQCRTVNHSWKTVSVVEEINDDKVTGIVRLNLRCASCKLRRYDEISRLTGALFHRSYDYPDGYLQVGRVPRDSFRLALVLRMLGRDQR